MPPVDQYDRPSSFVPVPARLRGLAAPAIIAVSVLVALAVNLAIWAAGDLAGGSFAFTDAGRIQSIAPGGVVILTAAPLAAGMTLATLLARWWPPVVRAAQVIGSFFAVITIAGTLATDFDLATTISLALSHVTLVPILIVGLEAIRQRSLAGVPVADDRTGGEPLHVDQAGGPSDGHRPRESTS